jgi:glutamate-5-semialdehyde dehydrogenase
MDAKTKTAESGDVHALMREIGARAKAAAKVLALADAAKKSAALKAAAMAISARSFAALAASASRAEAARARWPISAITAATSPVASSVLIEVATFIRGTESPVNTDLGA